MGNFLEHIFNKTSIFSHPEGSSNKTSTQESMKNNFITIHRYFGWVKVSSMGLEKTLRGSQSRMEKVFGTLFVKLVFVYLDDIIV